MPGGSTPLFGLYGKVPLEATGTIWFIGLSRCPKQGHTNPECEHGLIDGFLFSSRAETQRLGFRCIEHYYSDLNGLLNNFKRKCS